MNNNNDVLVISKYLRFEDEICLHILSWNGSKHVLSKSYHVEFSQNVFNLCS